jgi:hypothetical protein
MKAGSSYIEGGVSLLYRISRARRLGQSQSHCDCVNAILGGQNALNYFLKKNTYSLLIYKHKVITKCHSDTIQENTTPHKNSYRTTPSS